MDLTQSFPGQLRLALRQLSRRRESKEKIFRPTGTIPETVAMALVTSRRASLKKADLIPDRAGFRFHICHLLKLLTLGKPFQAFVWGEEPPQAPRICWGAVPGRESPLCQFSTTTRPPMQHCALQFPTHKMGGLLPASQAAVSEGAHAECSEPLLGDGCGEYSCPVTGLPPLPCQPRGPGWQHPEPLLHSQVLSLTISSNSSSDLPSTFSGHASSMGPSRASRQEQPPFREMK